MTAQLDRWRRRKLVTAAGGALIAIACASVTGGLAAPAFASSGGITGVSGKQSVTCRSCHAGGTTPDARFVGPSELLVGETATYRFEVTSLGSNQRYAGFNVAASAGTLTVLPDQGARKASNELTHTAPKQNVDGVAGWDFTWTAPAAAGMYTLFGAGNSVNRNGGTSGDAARATTLAVTVVDGQQSSPTPSATPLPPTATATASPTATATPDPPTATATEIPPTSTATPTVSATATEIPATSTATPVPVTATVTSSATVTSTVAAETATVTPDSPTATPSSTTTTATATETSIPATASATLTVDTPTAMPNSPTPTATEVSATPTATSAPSPCTGDCDGSGDVAVNELITAVNVALGNAALATCIDIDANRDGRADIGELIAAVNRALDGCPDTSL